MLLDLLFIIIGLALIIAGADFLTTGASNVASRFGLSQLVIGLTIVAFGTSAPELAVSLISSIEGNGGIAVGNVIGSNIFNILAILAICAIITPIPVERNTIRFEIPIATLAALLLMEMLSDTPLDGEPAAIQRSEAIILLFCGILFLLYTFYIGKQGENKEAEQPKVTEAPIKQQPLILSIIYILAGLGGLMYGGNLLVDNASKVARELGVSDTLIGLTLVSWGTSMPELATSAVAAFKKNTGMALGNVIGSNIFNIFFVLGVAGTVRPLTELSFTQIDLWVQLIGVLLALLFAKYIGYRVIKRSEGVAMLLVFILYTSYLIYSAL